MAVNIIQGDALSVLAGMPDESVHCVVTSPPYWGLRAYGGDPGMIGLEPTLDEHIANLVAVFREVRRVLRKDATLFLNYGDAYSSGMRSKYDDDRHKYTTARAHDSRPPTPAGLKPKDLMLLPARVAMALQADGWWLRSEIVWHKPNPMPESVTDRPTSAHEKVFLLAKSPRYYYDTEAVRSPMQPQSIARLNQSTFDGQQGGPKDPKVGNRSHRKVLENLHKRDKQRGHFRRHDGFNDRWDAMPKDEQQAMGANMRNVWTIATHAFSGYHYATFPPALVEPCIKAGTSARGVCGACGAPWVREVERQFQPDGAPDRYNMDESNGWAGFPRGTVSTSTTGWRPTCECNAAIVPAHVLDPFAGAGTVGLVAQRLGRDAVLIEINPEYAAMAERRIKAETPTLPGLQIA